MNGQDNRLKYIELFKTFEYQANEVRLNCRTSQRACENLAKQVGQARPKTAGEFEKVEALKAFIGSTSQGNEKMMQTLDFIAKSLIELASDCDDLLNVADLKNKIEMQSETISIMIQQNQNIISLRDEIRRRNQATA